MECRCKGQFGILILHLLTLTIFLQLYLCGSSKMAAAVKERLVLVVQEELKLDHAAAVERFDSIMIGRFATDVFE